MDFAPFLTAIKIDTTPGQGAGSSSPIPSPTTGSTSQGNGTQTATSTTTSGVTSTSGLTGIMANALLGSINALGQVWSALAGGDQPESNATSGLSQVGGEFHPAKHGGYGPEQYDGYSPQYGGYGPTQYSGYHPGIPFGFGTQGEGGSGTQQSGTSAGGTGTTTTTSTGGTSGSAGSTNVSSSSHGPTPAETISFNF